MSEIKPALSPALWKYAFEHSSRGNPRDSDGVFEDATPEEEHYFAALALYGQPFGFTREMVEALERVTMLQDGFHKSGDYALCKQAIAAINALLPPIGETKGDEE